MSTRNQWWFVASSDQHFSAESRPSLNWKSISGANSWRPDLILCIGDITNGGGSCIATSQLIDFVEIYEASLTAQGIPVKLCHGNHDNYAVRLYIKHRHGDTKYFFDHKDIRFICCGLFPDNMKWLARALDTTPGMPIIIYFHYNTIPTQKFADWWSDAKKEKFYGAIAGKNIKLIINGHIHANTSNMYRGINHLTVGRRAVAIHVSDGEIIPTVD